jgi:hypothetical protein
MKLDFRKKIISILGVLGICIQIYRYAFDLLSDGVLEFFVFAVFMFMALDIKKLKDGIISIIQKILRKDANQ